MTKKSYRPRVSDRTMVGNSATRLACEFQRTEWRRRDSEYETTGRKQHCGPVAPRLMGRSATGQDGQAAKEEVSAMWRGLDAGKLFLAFRQGEVFFT